MPAPPPFERSADQEYFRALEHRFIELRGAPLQLSPDDWRVCREWHALGIPRDLVETVLQESVEKQREKGKDVQRRMRYYHRAVLEAWQRIAELRAPAAPTSVPGMDLDARLRSLAAALPEGPDFRDVGAKIAALRGDAEAIETSLTGLDHALLEAAEKSLDPSAAKAVDDRLESSTRALSGRMPDHEIEAARDRLRQQILRRELNLPVLSLFSVDAAAGDRR
ncbi:MAG: hypothetical protein AAGN66_26755 [Acidobacteriota bacterium]